MYVRASNSKLRFFMSFTRSSLVFLSSLFADMDDVTISNLPEEVLVELVLLRSSDHESVRSFLCALKVERSTRPACSFRTLPCRSSDHSRASEGTFPVSQDQAMSTAVQSCFELNPFFEDCPPSVRSTFLKSLGYHFALHQGRCAISRPSCERGSRVDSEMVVGSFQLSSESLTV